MEENTTYFTLVTVGYKSPLECDDSRLLYLRYNPVQITSKDIKNVELAKWLSQEEFLPTPINDALKIFEVEEISRTVHMLIMSAKVNKATIHCFKTEFPLTEEDCESIVESANFDSYMRMKLLKSRII
jgi:hypothetical protein